MKRKALALRIVIGLVLLAGAVGKLLDVLGFARVLANYDVFPGQSGGLLVTWRDDANPGDPAEGVRIARVAGETRIEPLGPDRCRVTYTYLGDLGGNFPAAAEEKAWKAEPVGYLLAIRRSLALPIPPKAN